MKLSDVFFGFLYGSALILVLYFVIGLFYKPEPSTIVVYNTETPVYQESSIWPWYGGYNWYNTWAPWSYTGSGYYGRGYGGGYRRHGGGGGRPWGGGGRGGFGGGGRGGFGGGGMRGGGGGGRGGGGGGGRGGR